MNAYKFSTQQTIYELYLEMYEVKLTRRIFYRGHTKLAILYPFRFTFLCAFQLAKKERKLYYKNGPAIPD